MRLRPRSAPSAHDLLGMIADEVEASLPQAAMPAPNLPPLWVPNPDYVDGTPNPQRLAYESMADELFFGGAAGGGKSDILLGLATTRHRNSIIFRKEFTQFRGAEGLLERSRQVIGMRGSLNEGTFVWRRVDGFRALEFGAVSAPGDVNKYRGRPHDLKGFDEVADLTEAQYRFLIGWLRTNVVGQRCRVVATGNPPTTSEGLWVIKYWGPWLDETHPNPAKPGELRWYAVLDDRDVELESGEPFTHDGELIRPRSRTFIPARVEDNPAYMRTGYVDVLNNLPEPLRSQLRYGKFNVGVKDDDWQVVKTEWVVAAQQRWTPHPPCQPTAVGVDPSRGGADEFAIALRHGAWIGPLAVYQGVETADSIKGAGLIFKAVGGNTGLPIQIDIGGSAGPAVHDQARVLGLYVVAMDGSRASHAFDKSGKIQFANKRAEWHWKLREALDPASGEDVALPPDPQLRADLCAPRWHPTPHGVRVELKEETKKRIGRSPDRGEAVMYAMAQDWVRPWIEITTGVSWGGVSNADPDYVEALARAKAAYAKVGGK